MELADNATPADMKRLNLFWGVMLGLRGDYSALKEWGGGDDVTLVSMVKVEVFDCMKEAGLEVEMEVGGFEICEDLKVRERVNGAIGATSERTKQRASNERSNLEK